MVRMAQVCSSTKLQLYSFYKIFLVYSLEHCKQVYSFDKLKHVFDGLNVRGLADR